MLVHFDGWSSRHDEYVMLSSGRLRSLPPGMATQGKKRQKVLVQCVANTITRLCLIATGYRQVFAIGDRVQAKWEDGRMYFGRVLQVYAGMCREHGAMYCTGVCSVSVVKRQYVRGWLLYGQTYI